MHGRVRRKPGDIPGETPTAQIDGLVATDVADDEGVGRPAALALGEGGGVEEAIGVEAVGDDEGLGDWAVGLEFLQDGVGGCDEGAGGLVGEALGVPMPAGAML